MRSYLFSLLLVAPSAFAASAADWRSRSIYQVVTDRFANSNDSDTSCDTSDQKYCGGTWDGITNHLDYIQNMGFDAIWISPVVANIVADTGEGEGYHGYWTQDFNSLNSNFGTADDLKALATALHKRGMYLMFDVVVNHMAITALPPSFDFTTISPFSDVSDFHTQCFISDYTNQTNVEQCWLGDTTVALADINTENSTIVSTLNTWITNLISTYNVDGLRIDTVKHIRKDFWPDFATAAGVYTLGEVLDGDTTYVSPYTDVIDGVLDYPTYYPLTAAFSSTSGNLSALSAMYQVIQSNFTNGAFQIGSFLENHDQPRFQSITTDVALVKNAMTFPFMNDGIPILYYGQEQGYTGGDVPNNREALWFTAYSTSNTLVAHVTALNAARKLALASDSSFSSTALKFLPQSNEGTLAISKPPLLTLLTNVGNASSKTTTWNISSSYSLFSKKETLVDVLTCKTVTTDSDGGLTVTATSGLPQVLIPASKLNASGTLCTAAASTASSSSSGALDRNGASPFIAIVVTLAMVMSSACFLI